MSGRYLRALVGLVFVHVGFFAACTGPDGGGGDGGGGEMPSDVGGGGDGAGIGGTMAGDGGPPDDGGTTGDGHVVDDGGTTSGGVGAVGGGSSDGGADGGGPGQWPEDPSNVEWANLLWSPEEDEANGVDVDGAGNVYTVGYTGGDLGSETNHGGTDAFLAKHDPGGNLQMLKLLGTPEADQATDVAVDDIGNIYVVGSTYGDFGGESNTGGKDAFLAKYDPSGALQWARLMGSWGGAVSLDGAGHVYVTGRTGSQLGGQEHSGGSDVFVAKYALDGTRRWVRLLGGSGSEDVAGLSADASGDVYVTGETEDALAGESFSGGNKDAFVAKYGPDGMRQWVRLWGASDMDEGADVSVDGAGNVYALLYASDAPGNDPDRKYEGSYLAKYDGSGTRQLLEELEAAFARDVTVGESGSLYISGKAGDFAGEEEAGNWDAFAAKYDANGTLQWGHLLGTYLGDGAGDVVPDGSGNAYVVGSAANEDTGDVGQGGIRPPYDAFVAKVKE